jgi:hypothetical protein
MVDLYNIFSATVATNTILDNHQQVIDAIGKCRQLRPTPTYLIPYGLIATGLYAKPFSLTRVNKNSPFKPHFKHPYWSN